MPLTATSVTAGGRKTNALFLLATALARPDLLDWMHDHLKWWLDVVGYDEAHHAFPNHVDRHGCEAPHHTGNYTYNMQAAMAVALWRIGEHCGVEAFKLVAENMILERILPGQFADGYWNYSEGRKSPNPTEDPPEKRSENYQLLTLLKLTYLLPHPRWSNDPAFAQAMIRGCEYARTQIDPSGCVVSWPNLKAVRQGHHESKPPRPILRHQITGHLGGYGLAARYALVLARRPPGSLDGAAGASQVEGKR